MNVTCTCFSSNETEVTYSITDPTPDYLNFSFPENFEQPVLVDFIAAGKVMGSKYYLDYKGTITANYSWNEFDTSFEIIIFKCQDPNCL